MDNGSAGVALLLLAFLLNLMHLMRADGWRTLASIP